MAKHGISKTLILLPMIYIHIPPYALTSGIFCRNSYESVRMRRWHVLVKLANKISPPTLRGLKYSLFLMSESIYFYGVWVCHKRRAWIDPTLPKLPQYTQLRIIEQHLCRYMIFWCIQIFLSRMWPHIPDIYLANHHRDGAPGAWLYSVTLQRGATISTFVDSLRALITSFVVFDMFFSSNREQCFWYLRSIFIVCTCLSAPRSVYSCHIASIWNLL